MMLQQFSASKRASERASVTNANVSHISWCRRMYHTTCRLGCRRRRRLWRHWLLRRAASLTYAVVEQLLDALLTRAQSRLQWQRTSLVNHLSHQHRVTQTTIRSFHTRIKSRSLHTVVDKNSSYLTVKLSILIINYTAF